jgi:putative nucleotidyltransferase with HDIG domain
MSEKKSAFIQLADSDVMEVHRDEFISGSTVPCDVFVHLKEDHYILLARAGSKAVFNEMHLAERKDVTAYHVRRVDYAACVQQNLEVAGIILNNPNATESVKTDILARTCDTVFKEIAVLGFKAEAMKHSQMVISNIQKLIADKKDLTAVIELMGQVSSELVRHSMAVSAISLLIADGLGWRFPPTLQRLALGALLHDIGMKELPDVLIHKARHLMTREEVSLYETHISRSVDILKSMPTVPSEIVAIAYEHHENAIGEGYPRKIREFNMNPLSKVVGLADFFAELTVRNVNNPNSRTPEEALVFIESTLGQPFSKMAFQGLQRALGISDTSSIFKVAA